MDEQKLRQIVREELQSILDIKEKEQPRFLSVAQSAKILGLGTTSVYELCRQSDYNDFPCVRNGEKGKFLISYNALMNWANAQEKQNKAI
ncbi:helix-turn-helix domain-containing protein [Paraliobacillus sediminis]|uniref:helix-turn-helix domain-containing protein n=1 Tax=Paraliobacillus sediminis TaxID=1885916 RepID=UPI000E3C5549|nr:helix-turn-helix domain-containing protein [Paraliobacillus sediminis]